MFYELSYKWIWFMQKRDFLDNKTETFKSDSVWTCFSRQKYAINTCCNARAQAVELNGVNCDHVFKTVLFTINNKRNIKHITEPFFVRIGRKCTCTCIICFLALRIASAGQLINIGYFKILNYIWKILVTMTELKCKQGEVWLIIYYILIVEYRNVMWPILCIENCLKTNTFVFNKIHRGRWLQFTDRHLYKIYK